MSHLWLAESASQQGEQSPLARLLPTWREQMCRERRERRHPPFTQKMLCFLQFLRFSFALSRAGNTGVLKYKPLYEMMVALKVSEKNKPPLVSTEYCHCALVTSKQSLVLDLTVLEFQEQYCVTSKHKENKACEPYYPVKILGSLCLPQILSSKENLVGSLVWGLCCCCHC